MRTGIAANAMHKLSLRRAACYRSVAAEPSPFQHVICAFLLSHSILSFPLLFALLLSHSILSFPVVFALSDRNVITIFGMDAGRLGAKLVEDTIDMFKEQTPPH